MWCHSVRLPVDFCESDQEQEHYPTESVDGDRLDHSNLVRTIEQISNWSEMVCFGNRTRKRIEVVDKHSNSIRRLGSCRNGLWG